MADNLPEPKSRKESYLAKAAGMDVTVPEAPESREEQYLAAIAENGGGGGGGGTTYTAGDGIDITNDTISVDTDTIQPKLTAGTNITIDSDNVISASGGSSITPVQTTGTSTTDVMSQNATTSMVFQDPSTKRTIQIGDGALAGSYTEGIAIGRNSKTTGVESVSIGKGAGFNSSTNTYSVSIGSAAGMEINSLSGTVSLGAYSKATRAGEVNVGSTSSSYGYNSTNYRVIGGVHDPVDTHDAATKGYVDGRVIQNAGAPTTATEGTVGQLLEDTTNGKLYQCTAVSGNTYTWTEVGASGGVTPVQSTGTSTTDVMSQNAVTSMVFNDPSSLNSIQIGNAANSGGNTVAVGRSAYAGSYSGAIALGAWSACNAAGEMNIGSSNTNAGYNGTNYRLLTGVHDPVSAHDAATKGYVDTAVAGVGGGFTNGGTTAPTPATQGNVGDVYSYVDRSGSTPEPHVMVSNGDQTTTTATATLTNSLFDLTSNELVSPSSLKSYVEQELGVTVTNIYVLIQDGDCGIGDSESEAYTIVPLSSLATNGLVLPQFVLDSTYTAIEIYFDGTPVTATGQMAVDGDLPVTNANTLLAFAEQKTSTTADFSQANPYISLNNYNDVDGEWDMYFPDGSVSPVTVTNTELGANGFTVPTGMHMGEIEIGFAQIGGYQWVDVVNSVVENRLNGLTIVSISQTDYDNLQTKDPNTLYIITGA